MTRPRATLTVLACLVALAGCGGSHTTTSEATPRAAATPPATTARGENTAALFAAAYVRFLDGTPTTNRLPDATADVRALAGRAGPIPQRGGGELSRSASCDRPPPRRTATCWQHGMTRIPSTRKSQWQSGTANGSS